MKKAARGMMRYWHDTPAGIAVSGDEVEDFFPLSAVVVVEEEDSTRVKSSVWSVMPMESITDDSMMGINSPLFTQVSVEGRISPIIAADKTKMGKPEVSRERISSSLSVCGIIALSAETFSFCALKFVSSPSEPVL